jgi:hypothetical protein
MVLVDRAKWIFGEERVSKKDRLVPYYEQLERAGLLPELTSVLNELRKVRNGFDHAWTGQDFRGTHGNANEAGRKLRAAGEQLCDRLEAIIERLPLPPGLAGASATT